MPLHVYASSEFPNTTRRTTKERRARCMLAQLAGMALALLALATTPTFGHGTSETRTGIIVEDASMSPTAAGKPALLRLAITNERARPIFLTGIRSDVSDPASLEFEMPGKGQEVADRIPILRGETLRLNSSHLHAWFEKLRRPLRSGDTVRLTIDFDGLEVVAVADVH